MQSLDQSLADLARDGLITKETALLKAVDVEQFEKWYQARRVEVLNQVPRTKTKANRLFDINQENGHDKNNKGK
jgi:Tfp pilus assembly ATPase PilU